MFKKTKMSELVNFKVASSKEHLFQLYDFLITKWHGPGHKSSLTEQLLKIHEGREDLLTAFYLEDATSNAIVATAIVERSKAYFKEADRSQAISSIPDPNTIGLQNATALVLSGVVEDEKHKGMSRVLIEKVLDTVENQIVQQELNKSDDSKKDSFRNMTTTDGIFDKVLGTYYLSKKYFWVYYSADDWFEFKAGFKRYTLGIFELPLSLADTWQLKYIRDFLSSVREDGKEIAPSKTIHFLRSSREKDQETIKSILLFKEMEILGDLNRNLFHPELSSGRRSSSSLTNMSNVLQMSKIGSFSEMSAVPEAIPATETPSNRRRLSVLKVIVPKIGMKPDYSNFEENTILEKEKAKYYINDHDYEEVEEFTDIQGILLTNQLHNKTYFIVWSTLRDGGFYVYSMGEMPYATTESYERGGVSRTPSRRNSASQVNQLSGYNFKDLDTLFLIACEVGKKRKLSTKKLQVAVNDISPEYPVAVLRDYFINYLPSTYEDHYSSQDPNEEKEGSKILFVEDPRMASVSPSIRRFGISSSNFDLDWVAIGMWAVK